MVTVPVSGTGGLENIREAIAQYHEPDPIELTSGAVLREVSVG